MNIAIARGLGAAEAGYYLLALAIITFMSSLCRVGLDNTVLRFVGANAAAGNWGAVNAVFRRSFWVVLLVSSAAAVAIWLLSPWIANDVFGKQQLAPVLRAIVPGLIGLSLCFLISFALQAIGKVNGAVFSQSLGIAIGIIAISPMLRNAVAASTAYAAISIVIACLAFLWWAKSHSPEVGHFSHKILWGSALPLWVVTGASALQQWSGQFVAGAYVASDELAQLAVAQRTAFLISFLLIAVNLVVAPRFATFYQQGRIDELRKLAKTTVKLILLTAGPCILILLLEAERIMSIFGVGFSRGGNLLRILAIGQFFNAVTGSVGYLLMMSGHEKDMRNIALIVGPSAILLSFLLTPHYGVVGAAIATAVSVAAQNMAATLMVKKRLGFSTIVFWRK